MSGGEMRPLLASNIERELAYDPETGQFTWLVAKRGWNGGVRAGDRAGTLKDGYTVIGVQGRNFRAHRLAWFLMTGAFPPCDIDHANGDRMDNRWSNLRLATRPQNNVNAAPSRRNRTGIRGVSVHQSGRYEARISIGGTIKFLGLFESLSSAAEARIRAEKQAFGEFSFHNRSL